MLVGVDDPKGLFQPKSIYDSKVVRHLLLRAFKIIYLHRLSMPRRSQKQFLKAMEYLAIALQNDLKLNSPKR